MNRVGGEAVCFVSLISVHSPLRGLRWPLDLWELAFDCGLKMFQLSNTLFRMGVAFPGKCYRATEKRVHTHLKSSHESSEESKQKHR